MKQLVVATANLGKLQEMRAYLADFQWEVIPKPETLEIEETGTTFLANACLKASQVAQATGGWAIADDSGLEVQALNGVPGVYSARYGQTDLERIQRLLRELGEEPNRAAQFVCAIAIARPNGLIALEAEGVCQGEILHTPRGSNGFGYDPVFYIPGQGMTFAEMPQALKRSLSHRGRAFQALLPKMQTLYENSLFEKQL